MRTDKGFYAGRTRRLLVVVGIIIVSGCSTSHGGSKATDDKVAETAASSGSKSGYVDPIVSNTSSKREATGPAPGGADPARPGDVRLQSVPEEDGLAAAVSRPNAIKAGSSSIYSTAAPEPEYAPEEPATGPVPAYIPPTGINAMRGSVFSTRAPQAPQQ